MKSFHLARRAERDAGSGCNGRLASTGQRRGTVANERYRHAPGAVFRLGNLPAMINAGEDVILTAIGPGSEAVRGQIDNTDVFRIMVDMLGLGEAAVDPVLPVH
jgi:hypothetical protein